MKTLRLFALLDRLRASSSPVAAETLAQAFEVSVRTIYRDMVALQAIGAPVRGEPGMGYQLERGYFLPPLQFDADEIEAIALGVRLAAARGDDALAEAAARVGGKLAAVMNDELKRRYETLPLRAAAKDTSERVEAAHWLPVLRQAIRQRKILYLDYLDLAGNESRRLARPLGLTAFDTVWLLTAWCESKQDFRNFRLDRISAAAETGDRYKHEQGRRFEDYLATL